MQTTSARGLRTWRMPSEWGKADLNTEGVIQQRMRRVTLT